MGESQSARWSAEAADLTAGQHAMLRQHLLFPGDGKGTVSALNQMRVGVVELFRHRELGCGDAGTPRRR